MKTTVSFSRQSLKIYTFTWNSVRLKMIDKRKKWAQICARVCQFLDVLPLALMNLENGRAPARARLSWARAPSAANLSGAH